MQNEILLINNKTLSNIADAIRTMDETSDEIQVSKYPERILNLKPSVEDYMRISDYMKYPTPINENDYTVEAIAETEGLIKLYTEMEGENNG